MTVIAEFLVDHVATSIGYNVPPPPMPEPLDLVLLNHGHYPNCTAGIEFPAKVIGYKRGIGLYTIRKADLIAAGAFAENLVGIESLSFFAKTECIPQYYL